VGQFFFEKLRLRIFKKMKNDGLAGAALSLPGDSLIFFDVSNMTGPPQGRYSEMSFTGVERPRDA